MLQTNNNKLVVYLQKAGGRPLQKNITQKMLKIETRIKLKKQTTL